MAHSVVNIFDTTSEMVSVSAIAPDFSGYCTCLIPARAGYGVPMCPLTPGP